MIERLLDRKTIGGALLYGHFSHRLSGRFGLSIHADKRRISHIGSERRELGR